MTSQSSDKPRGGGLVKAKEPQGGDSGTLANRNIRDKAIKDVAFVVAIEAPCPAKYRRAVADYIYGRVGNL